LQSLLVESRRGRDAGPGSTEGDAPGRFATRSDDWTSDGGTRRSGVGGNWRIRHKLVLGLGLVVAIMALLLLGVFKGLTSFRATMHVVDRKLAESKKANELLQAVKDLADPGPDGPTFPLKQKLKAIKESRFQEYKDEFERTIGPDGDPDDKYYVERGWI